MPELVIKYKNKRTFDALVHIAKYFEFSVEKPKAKPSVVKTAKKEPDFSYFGAVTDFEDATVLRKKAWNTNVKW